VFCGRLRRPQNTGDLLPLPAREKAGVGWMRVGLDSHAENYHLAVLRPGRSANIPWRWSYGSKPA